MVLEHLISSREMIRYEIAGTCLIHLYTMPLVKHLYWELILFLGAYTGECLLEVGEGLDKNTESGTDQMSVSEAYSA